MTFENYSLYLFLLWNVFTFSISENPDSHDLRSNPIGNKTLAAKIMRQLETIKFGNYSFHIFWRELDYAAAEPRGQVRRDFRILIYNLEASSFSNLEGSRYIVIGARVGFWNGTRNDLWPKWDAVWWLWTIITELIWLLDSGQCLIATILLPVL